jgi:signal transduction histidine kinase
MKIQTKLTFLTVLCLGIFAIAFFFYMNLEKSRLSTIFYETKNEKNAVFDKLLTLKGAPLEMLANDYTYWDEMVDFISTRDLKWAQINIDFALPTFQVNAVWVYDTNYTLLYSINDVKESSLKELPFTKEEFGKLFAQRRLRHFFINTSSGLMEIRGATIHPTADPKRETTPRGYFLTGRLWNKEFLSELSNLMDGRLTLLPFFEEKTKPNTKHFSEKGTINLSKILTDFDNRPLMIVDLLMESETIRVLNKTSTTIISVVMILIAIAFLLLVVLLNQWVSAPLRLISRTLETGSVIYISAMQKEKAEFGDISRLICKFFTQREALVKEVVERKKAEEDLKNTNFQLKETQGQLIQAEKLNAVGQLASGVAHEVRNPLGIIIQGVNYLENKIAAKEADVAEVLAMLKDSVKRADKIINSLLDFSRATSIGLQPEDIAPIIENSLNLVKNHPAFSNIEIIRQIALDMPKVLVDKNKMEQVFINVLMNAFQAMPAGGTLAIRSYDKKLEETRNGIGNRSTDNFKPGERAVIVEFEDTGIGITREHLDKMFDPFFTTKGPRGGAGLGLSVSRNILHMHKGLIFVESQVGKGTKVTIILKLSGR